VKAGCENDSVSRDGRIHLPMANHIKLTIINEIVNCLTPCSHALNHRNSDITIDSKTNRTIPIVVLLPKQNLGPHCHFPSTSTTLGIYKDIEYMPPWAYRATVLA
jgi:hypothetical protein